MLIVFLLRTILSETIKLSGASRRHVALHPAAISTRARSFHREYANNVAFERDAGIRIADTGYRDLHLVDEVANQFPQIGRLLCIAQIACRIMHSPTRDPMPLMEKPTYLFRVNHEVRWGISKPAATGALGSGWNRALAKWPVSRRHLSQNSGRPPPADVLLWTLADLVIEPKSRLCADSVAKVFLSHRSQIIRAVR